MFGNHDSSAALVDDVRSSARKRRVGADLLLAAVNEYAVIESRSKALPLIRQVVKC
jgi:hypothetical protein